jgi:hypothetical protein
LLNFYQVRSRNASNKRGPVKVYFHSYDIPLGTARNEKGVEFPWHYPAAATNDCLYRSMGDARYVVTVDVDEVFVPSYEHGDLVGFVEEIERNLTKGEVQGRHLRQSC